MKKARISRKNPALPWVLRTSAQRIPSDWDATYVRNEYESTRPFDEFYVGGWFGMERMDHRIWEIWIGDVQLNVTIPRGNKPVEVRLYEGKLKDANKA